jgi:hypothetical protein
MDENNKPFYPSDMFEFIHHPEYGYRDLKRVIMVSIVASIVISKFLHCTILVTIVERASSTKTSI